MKTFAAVGLCVAAFCAVQAETKTVSYAQDRIIITGGDVIDAETEKIGATYPAGLPAPLFWIDASDRKGWAYDADGGVTNIPDKAGSDRFLTTKPEGNYWWSIGQTPPTLTAPTLVAGSADFAHPYLDFGAWPNGHGLVFDGYRASASCSPSNTLEHVGSVIAVYGSQMGGGYFLYGAYSLTGGREKRSNGTARGNTPHTNSWNPADYAAIVYNANADGSTAFSPLGYSYMWQDGMMTASQRVGFGKSWQVLSLCPTNALVAYCGIGPSQLNDPFTKMGGQRVAEMIFFNKVLSNAEQRKIEEYLQAKWFKPQRGYDGDAHVGRIRVTKNDPSMEGQVATLHVPAGEKLTVDRVQGGRGVGAALVKTGEGAIEFGDLSDYTGTLKLEGGTLAFTRKPVPTLAELPEPFFHVDASAPDALEGYVENGTNFVTVWNNLATNTWRYNQRITCARSRDWTWSGHTINTDCRFVKDALGPGLHAVDFGNFKYVWTLQNKVDGYFGCMWFASDAAANPYPGLGGITTVIGVMGAHNGGGQYLGNSGSTHGFNNEPFARGGGNSQSDSKWYEPVAKIYPIDLPEKQIGYKATPWKTNVVSQIWVDGERDFVGNNYHTPGYHVVAQQTSGMSAGIIGGMMDGNGNMYNGGGRYCELMIYDRVLKEEEILDVSAYLKKKWLNGVSTGYARPDDMKVADIQHLDVTGPATIDVPAGATVKIGKLILHAKLTKTGAGTLEIVSSENPGLATVEVQGGAVVNANPSDVTAKCELAESPSFHIDPNSKQRLMPFMAANGDSCPIVDMEPDVRRQNTMRNRDGISYTHLSDWRPVPADSGPTLDFSNPQNGNPMFNFGTGWGYYRWCTLGESLDSVRHVYFVWDTRYGGGRPFGAGRIPSLRVQTADGSAAYTEENEKMDDFYRTSNGTNWPLFQDNLPFFAYIDELRTNGVVVAKKNFYPDGKSTYLVEVKLKVGMHISTIGMQHWQDNSTGALRLGEMLVYQRELTERERTATSNYLMKKWMGASEAALPDLPEAQHKEGPFIPDPYVVEGEQVLDLGRDYAVSEIRGDGTLVINGNEEHRFASADLSYFTGTVAVTNGTLRLTGEQTPVDCAMPARGMILGVDAMATGLVENATNPGWLDKWHSTVGDGWYAKGMTARIDKTGLNGKPIVVMDRADGQACARFVSPTGAPMYGDCAMLDGIRTVLWVVGSDLGGGFLLGGGTNALNTSCKENFARGHWSAMDDPSYPLYNAQAQKEVREADWFMNGGRVDGGTTGLSGDWDVVGMTLQPDAADCTRAQGFAFSWAFTAQYFGHQKLAEVAIYDRVLLTNEVFAAHAYLARKWGLRPYTQTVTNNAAVYLAADATLDCGGYRQYLGSVGGQGTVVGDVEAAGLVYDAAVQKPLAVNGRFSFARGFRVTVRNAAGYLKTGEYKILTTDGLDGSFDKTAVEVQGMMNPPECLIFRRGNDLYLRVGSLGLTVIFRS